jgi:hypothetical protein
VLYDGTLGTAPDAQPWLTFYSLPTGGTKTVGAGKTTYDSGAATHSIIGVPKNAATPVLDRVAGYTVSIDLKVLTEAHANNNRSGVSLLVLSSDLLGIELGFWTNEIWAQSGSDFLHAEGAAYDTTASSKTYDLVVTGSNYSLLGNGAPILNGALRNYSGFGFPYTTTNWIFVGDDTTSARGSFEISRLAVVPEPAAFSIILLPFLLAARVRSTRMPVGAL